MGITYHIKNQMMYLFSWKNDIQMCDINSINSILWSYTYKHIDKDLYVIMSPMCIYSFRDNPSDVKGN